MKFTLNSKVLTDALAVVSKVQAAKNSIPILGSVLFTVKNDSLTLMCSDSELFIEATVPIVESDGDFSVAIPATDLVPLKSVSDQPVSIECSYYENGAMACTITYLNGQFVSTAEQGDEFPRPSAPADDAVTNSIPLAYMLDGIRCTKFAALDGEKAELKPQLAGVYFDMQPYGMIAVACDGERLAKVWYKDVHTEQPFGFIMINKAVKVVATILAKLDDVENVDLTYNNRNFRISAGAYTVYGLLPEMKYPAYNSVIPQDAPMECVISRQDLIGALSRVGVFSEVSNSVVFHFSKDNLTVESQDLVWSRSAKENIPCQYSAEPLVISLNYRNLSEMLNAMTGEDSVSARMIDGTKPLTLRPVEQDENTDYLCLIMPIAPLTSNGV